VQHRPYALSGARDRGEAMRSAFLEAFGKRVATGRGGQVVLPTGTATVTELKQVLHALAGERVHPRGWRR
jgi:hypothetical protein